MGLKINGISVAGLGLPGKSAYEQAKQGGYTGTEEEFNALLAGINTMQDDISNIGDRVDNLTYADVGAAPDGYGLGEAAAVLTHEYDLDTVTANGWYIWGSLVPKNTPELLRGGGTYMNLFVSGDSKSGLTQTMTCYIEGYEGKIERTSYAKDGNIAWRDWEWINPPMYPGVEYRTTERYLGKPVYAKLINCGALPNATTKTVAHGIKNFLNGVSTQVRLDTGADVTNWFGITSILATASDASITTKGNQSAFSAIMKIKYTKTTD